MSYDRDEAMLAQINDLRSRLALVSRTPDTALDEAERASDWLRKKAEKRVWHDGPNRRTEAMRRTPRQRLMERALRGHWERFPVSPARFEPELRRIVGVDGYYNELATGPLARALEAQVDLLNTAATSDLERLALHRAAMTMIIEVMDHVDDSLAKMSEVFAASERAYLELARGAAGLDGLLRDLLELAVWERLRAAQRSRCFPSRARRRERERRHPQSFAAIISELRRERLDTELARAVALRRTVLAPWA